MGTEANSNTTDIGKAEEEIWILSQARILLSQVLQNAVVLSTTTLKWATG